MRLGRRPNRSNRRLGSGSEPEVVPCALLAAEVQSFRERWERERPRPEQTINRNTPHKAYFGAVDWLTQESGIPTRSIYRIVNGESKFVALSTAMMLLMAMDRDYLLSNGSIPVLPNPLWSRERWVAYMRSAIGDALDESSDYWTLLHSYNG